jgi:hypothetical protein
MQRAMGALVLIVALASASCGDGQTSGAITAPSTPTTFSISGQVLDAASRPVPGAAVEVLDGPLTGRMGTADAGGWFALPGPFNGSEAVRIRAVRDGYDEQIQTVTCCPSSGLRTVIVVFSLSTLVPDVAGGYTLTIQADDACPHLPEEVRRRTYGMSIAATPPDLAWTRASHGATLSGATFFAAPFGRQDWLPVDVTPSQLRLIFDTEGPWILEELAPSTYLAFYGQATVAVGTAGSTMSGPLNGTIEMCTGVVPPHGYYYDCRLAGGVNSIRCTSTHRVTVTRR